MVLDFLLFLNLTIFIIFQTFSVTGFLGELMLWIVFYDCLCKLQQCGAFSDPVKVEDHTWNDKAKCHEYKGQINEPVSQNRVHGVLVFINRN